MSQREEDGDRLRQLFKLYATNIATKVPQNGSPEEEAKCLSHHIFISANGRRNGKGRRRTHEQEVASYTSA